MIRESTFVEMPITPKRGGLIGQFVTHDTFVTTTQAGETLQPAILAVAQKNGFESVFTTYFKGQPATFLSPMDNASARRADCVFSLISPRVPHTA